ncbi:sigma-70 RNA polymerase sigma factor region 4 domain-containing protein [Alkaliphilus oremlandii]|uniref:Putative RNA polymerase, sigma 28 subunit, FliA/WhiG family n=1 Tax=Alkaliphilus oremlandii (strain OhILAs) TaxID=350688 RepID=A8MFT4_ALKOO|nr:sigma-70 family RNA polymerase sigma factor [Alkaliphilus oremlandii]ABW17723.1 putative RNA polymerase, sigma 28 subunit, FliA/WhiG family [Alkaliphilus oremlandii OhILAs]
MNQLAKGFLNNQTFSNNLVKDLSLDNLQDEFNGYAFKVYLNGYIKKTIVFGAMQIKKKSSQISKKEELSLNIIDPNFNEERINLITDTVDDFVENIGESLIKEDCCDYSELLYDRELILAINTLTDRQKEILHRCVIIGESDTVVAKKLGITKQGVNKAKKSALNKIRKKLSYSA